MAVDRHGQLFLLVGPSGVGKNTLMEAAIRRLPGLTQMPTATTRSPRPTETEGREHLFVTDEQFDNLVRDRELVEWQIVHGWRYGTVRSLVEHHIINGSECIADTDILGARLLREQYPDAVALIFVAPPAPRQLYERIRARGVEPEEEIEIRLKRATWELELIPECDYLIINDDLETAIAELTAIIIAERTRRRVSEFNSVGARRRTLHITAAGLVLDSSNRHILLTRRIGALMTDDWDLPGGHLEPGEFPHEAVIRQVLAQTGHQISIQSSRSSLPRFMHEASLLPDPSSIMARDAGHHTHLEFIYRCESIRVAETRVSDTKWVPTHLVESLPISAELRQLLLILLPHTE